MKTPTINADIIPNTNNISNNENPFFLFNVLIMLLTPLYMIEENIIVELSSEKHAADVAAISMFYLPPDFYLR